MKRKLLLLTCTLLLLSGCGVDEDAATASSASEPQPTETAAEYDEEYYLELIPEVSIEILGIRSEWEHPYSLYLIDGTITELSEEYLIAEGVLSNEWHATAEVVDVKYYISDGIIHSGELVIAEPLRLTPTIPFLSEESLPSIYRYIRRYMNSYSLSMDDFTQENYPTIEIGEGIWENNYNYTGSLLITDANGNKYYTSEVLWSYDECFLDTKDEYDCAWGTSIYGTIKEVE